MNCEYCGQDEWRGSICARCGGKRGDHATKDRIEKGEPFPYNGFIVWPIRKWNDFTSGSWDREFHFYLGDRLIEIISISKEMWQELYPPSVPAAAYTISEPMKFVWELFRVAQGDKEELIQVGKNNYDKKPAMFITIARRYDGEKDGWPTEKISRYESMTWDELLALKDRVNAT